MSLLENIIVVLAGLLSLAGALALVTQSNPVRAALGLLVSLAGTAVIYLTLGAHFVGFVQLIIYAGAIVVLFLFAIVSFPLGKHRRDRIPLTSILGWIAVSVLVVLLVGDLAGIASTGFLNLPVAERSYDDALKIGKQLVFKWTYPFELVGVLLLIALVAALHLTGGGFRRENGESSKGGNDP